MAGFSAATSTSDKYECGNCSHEMAGYNWTELSAEGWKSYSDGSNVGKGFLLCGECDRVFAARREVKQRQAALSQMVEQAQH